MFFDWNLIAEDEDQVFDELVDGTAKLSRNGIIGFITALQIQYGIDEKDVVKCITEWEGTRFCIPDEAFKSENSY